IAEGGNYRSPDATDPQTFPTLTDLAGVIPEIVDRQGFDPEAHGRILGSLYTRVAALRTGPRGRMLDAQESVPAEDLFGGNVLIELESLGDDDDKAFIMSLLLIRLVEHRRAEARQNGLADEEETKHLLVVEEAHRLLSAAPQKTDENQIDAR